MKMARSCRASGWVFSLGCLLAFLVTSFALAHEWSDRPVAELVTLAQAEDLGTRNHAIIALGQVGGPEAEGALVTALSNAEWTSRWRAAEGLGCIGGVSSVPALMLQLAAEVTAEDTLKKSEKTIPLHGYITWPEFLQRQIAIAVREVLKRNQTPEGLQCRETLLATMQNDGEPERVRTQVALLLAELGDKRTVSSLIKVLTSEPSGAFRAFAAEALGRLGAQEAVPALEQALADPYVTPDRKGIPMVRYAAERALQQLRQAPQPST